MDLRRQKLQQILTASKSCNEAGLGCRSILLLKVCNSCLSASISRVLHYIKLQYSTEPNCGKMEDCTKVALYCQTLSETANKDFINLSSLHTQI